jgi:hypothetical protein
MILGISNKVGITERMQKGNQFNLIGIIEHRWRLQNRI